MLTRQGTKRAREALDARFREWGSAARFAAPHQGWIRAVRDALGMPAAELAVRMGVSGATVRALENKEVAGGIRLSSLRRAAEAMDCTLVYAFVPNDSLEATVARQAEAILGRRVSRTQQTMALEAQEEGSGYASREAQIQRIIDEGRIWSRARAEG